MVRLQCGLACRTGHSSQRGRLNAMLNNRLKRLEPVRQIYWSDQFLVAGDGKAVGHPRDIIADSAQQRRLCLASPPTLGQAIGVVAVEAGQIPNDPLRLEADRPERVAVVEIAVEMALQF